MILTFGYLAEEGEFLKILEKNLKKGFVKVIPETMDDLWHLYNIIYEKNEVYAYTSREIKPAERYARPKRGKRTRVFLGINVERVGWDRLLGRLRVHGVIREAPDIVSTGAHHTLNITLNTPVTIVKEEWPKHHIERLDRASRTSEKPIIIVAIDDENYAIATTTQYGVEVRVEERTKLPGKLEAEKRDVATNKYFRSALRSLRHIWTPKKRPIVVIGVGFVKTGFVRFLKDEATDISGAVVDVKSVNNSGVAGIYEALRSGVLLKTSKHLRIAEETETIEEILKRLGKGASNVTYGIREIEKTAESGAVEKIIVADTMLRESSDEKRLFLEQLMRTVEQKKGEIMVISTEHEAGEKLVALGGIAAFLRFAIN